MSKDTLKIHKGELVILVPGQDRHTFMVPCWRRTNKQEDEAWQQYVQRFPLDDAGEPRVRSPNPHTTDYFQEGTPAIVIKARCTALIGWQSHGKLVQVVVPSNGNTYYVQRKYVAKAVSDENSVHQ